MTVEEAQFEQQQHQQQQLMSMILMDESNEALQQLVNELNAIHIMLRDSTALRY